MVGVVYGSWTTIYLRKEQKRSAQLDNDNKVAESWKGLYEESQMALKGERERNQTLQNHNDELHKEKSKLMEAKDGLSTKCAVSELLICKELNCPKRNPPLGSKVFADEFARQIESERNAKEDADDDADANAALLAEAVEDVDVQENDN